MQSVVLRVGLKKAQITGTLAACLITMTSGKMLTYMWRCSRITLCAAQPPR